MKSIKRPGQKLGRFTFVRLANFYVDIGARMFTFVFATRKKAMTKIEMSQRIIQALYNLQAPASADRGDVKRMARAPKEHLEHQHKLALKVLKQNERIQ